MKKFNITAICNPKMHYMVDISGKLAETKKLIDEGLYFTINRGRQTGKTTLMGCLERDLADEYFMIGISFEGVSDIFDDKVQFCSTFFRLIAGRFRLVDPAFSEKARLYGEGVVDYDLLSGAITRFCADIERDTGKQVVLMIDEVDKASNYWVFMDFIGMLRTKYIACRTGYDSTFKSVILAGVNDIKRLKPHTRDRHNMSASEAEALKHSEFNSPWNIATDYEVEVDFSADEIVTLLDDYRSEHDVVMDRQLVAETLYKHTSGYPFLVSKLCKIIAEKLDDNWTVDGVQQAINILLDQKNTLFDDLIKNIDNVPILKSVISNLLLDNEVISFSHDVHEIGAMYSILKNDKGKVKVHNFIFATRIYNYLIALREVEERKLFNYSTIPYGNPDGSLDMERALLKFQEYFKSVYSTIDERFLEREGRLLLLAFFASSPVFVGSTLLV